MNINPDNVNEFIHDSIAYEHSKRDNPEHRELIRHVPSQIERVLTPEEATRRAREMHDELRNDYNLCEAWGNLYAPALEYIDKARTEALQLIADQDPRVTRDYIRAGARRLARKILLEIDCFRHERDDRHPMLRYQQLAALASALASVTDAARPQRRPGRPRRRTRTATTTSGIPRKPGRPRKYPKPYANDPPETEP